MNAQARVCSPSRTHNVLDAEIKKTRKKDKKTIHGSLYDYVHRSAGIFFTGLFYYFGLIYTI